MPETTSPITKLMAVVNVDTINEDPYLYRKEKFDIKFLLSRKIYLNLILFLSNYNLTFIC